MNIPPVKSAICFKCKNRHDCQNFSKGLHHVIQKRGCIVYDFNNSIKLDGYSTGKEQVGGGNTVLSIVTGNTNMGLCANCRIRGKCRHSVAEAGVWHCRDYC